MHLATEEIRRSGMSRKKIEDCKKGGKRFLCKKIRSLFSFHYRVLSFFLFYSFLFYSHLFVPSEKKSAKKARVRRRFFFLVNTSSIEHLQASDSVGTSFLPIPSYREKFFLPFFFFFLFSHSLLILPLVISM